MTDTRSAALVKAHHAIRNEFAEAIAKHFQVNKDILRDPAKLKATTDAAMTLMMHILRITDELERDVRDEYAERERAAND